MQRVHKIGWNKKRILLLNSDTTFKYTVYRKPKECTQMYIYIFIATINIFIFLSYGKKYDYVLKTLYIYIQNVTIWN